MKQYEDMLKNELEEIKNEELDALPDESEVDCEFSDKFEKNMHNMLSPGKSPAKIFLIGVAKRAAVFVFITAVFVSAVVGARGSKKEKFDFRYSVHHQYVEISYDYLDRPKGKFIPVLPTNIPGGYIMTDLYEQWNCYQYIKWENGENRIYFRQKTKDSKSCEKPKKNYDTMVEELEFNGVNVLYWDIGTYIFCYWTDENCLYELSYSSSLGKEFAEGCVGKMVERKE